MQSSSPVLTDIDHAQTPDSAPQSVDRSVNFHTPIVPNQYNMDLDDQSVDDGPVIAVQSDTELDDGSRTLEHQLPVISPSHSAIVEGNRTVHQGITDDAGDSLSLDSSSHDDYAGDTDDQTVRLGRALADQLYLHHGCVDGSCSVGSGPSPSDPSQLGLEDVMSLPCPDTLSCVDRIGDGNRAWEEEFSPESRQRIYCGYVNGDCDTDQAESVPTIALISDPELLSIPMETTFDIDSAGGYASSLAVCKQGILWYSISSPVSDLQSSLHLAPLMTEHVDENGKTHHEGKPIHRIPHLQFGRVAGFEEVTLYILFPQLYNPKRKSTRLEGPELVIWNDRVLLPALRQSYSGSIMQHLPASSKQIQLNSTARRAERQVHDQGSRVQLLQYFLDAERLDHLWNVIQYRISNESITMFKDAKIFFACKNLKLRTKSRRWSQMYRRFYQKWSAAIHSAFVLYRFVDIGKEVCPEGIETPVSLTWKRCCLESYATWIEGVAKTLDCENSGTGTASQDNQSCQDETLSDPENAEPDQESPSPSLFKKEFYPLVLLRDTGALTLETSARSSLRHHGLLYCQLYNSCKEVFAAGNCYPFGNESVDTLCLDPQLVHAWADVGRATSHQPKALRKAYLHTKERCHEAIEAAQNKSFGTREEIRVEDKLLDVIHQEMMQREEHYLQSSAQSVRSCLHHHTPILLNWYRWNLNKFCTGFEMVFSLQEPGFVRWEHSRVMMMFIRCLLYIIGGQGRHPRHSSELWIDRKPPQHQIDGRSSTRSYEGMGIGVMLEQYGYGWLMNKIDWETMIFCRAHRSSLLFNTPSLQGQYRQRYRALRGVKDDFIFVQDICDCLRKLPY